MTSLPKQPPTFEVHFIGPNVRPETIPLRVLSDCLQAVQSLALGLEPHATAEHGSIGLVRVRSGSAIYECRAHQPKRALRRLRHVGKMLTAKPAEVDETVETALRPVEIISRTARSLDCQIHVCPRKQPDVVLASFEPETYKRFSESMLVTGDSIVEGELVRVGGARTETRCAMRIPGRVHLLFCDVSDRDLSRKLGQHLYQRIVAAGTATWIQQSWHLFRFTVRGFEQPKQGSLLEALQELRKSGGDAWDTIDDPDSYLRG